jgi:hypothetical protein
MVINYTNIFHYRALQNIPKFGVFGLKINHLATLHFTARKKKANSLVQELL